MRRKALDPWPWLPRRAPAHVAVLDVAHDRAVTAPSTAHDTHAKDDTPTMPILQSTNVSGIPFNPGVYLARVISTREAEAKGDSKYDKGLPRLQVELRVNYRGESVDVNDFITLYPKLGKRTKGYSLFAAALFDGGEIPEGTPLDTDDLTNARVQVVIRPKPDGTGNMIESYMGAPARAPKKQPAPVVVDEDDDLLDD